jgi:hypothetical protein
LPRSHGSWAAIDPVAPSRISDTSASIAMQKVVGSSPITPLHVTNQCVPALLSDESLESAFFPLFLK